MERFNFSNYCASCALYGTKLCPHLNEVDGISDWKKLNCDKFKDVNKEKFTNEIYE